MWQKLTQDTKLQKGQKIRKVLKTQTAEGLDVKTAEYEVIKINGVEIKVKTLSSNGVSLANEPFQDTKFNLTDVGVISDGLEIEIQDI